MSDSLLAERIRSHDARVAVMGQGYVGLPLAVEFAKAGFPVVGFDTNPDRVNRLKAGSSYIADVEQGMVGQLVGNGRYSATSDPAALDNADVIVICVPTPLDESREPDMSFVRVAAEEITRHLRPGQLVILESTSYPGTTEEFLLPFFENRGLGVGVDFYLACSPERVDPGNRKFGVRDIPKIVGGVTPICGRVAALLYRQIIVDVTEVSSPKVAELTKLYENTFRAVNIGLANEFALMCRHLGVSSREVIDAAATKPFGFLAFYPGPGVGGHCIGVDPAYLAWRMRLIGFESRFIRTAEEVNRAMPAYAVQLIASALNGRKRSLNGSRILALGIAYKRGVSDTRESPALEVICELLARGAHVAYSDPYVPAVRVEGKMLKAVELSDEELRQADCVVILTDHCEVDYSRVLRVAESVVDTRNATYGIPAPAERVVRL